MEQSILNRVENVVYNYFVSSSMVTGSTLSGNIYPGMNEMEYALPYTYILAESCDEADFENSNNWVVSLKVVHADYDNISTANEADARGHQFNKILRTQDAINAMNAYNLGVHIYTITKPRLEKAVVSDETGGIFVSRFNVEIVAALS